MKTRFGLGLRCLLNRGRIAAFVALCTGCSYAHADILYGITFNDPGRLIAIDPVTGAGTVVGNLSSSMNSYGVAATAGSLYAYDQKTELLRQLNPATGATVGSTDLGLNNLVGEGDIEFRSDGVGFLSTAGGSNGPAIYTFNLSANSGQLLGTTTDVIDGLAFGPGNVLYALGQNTAALYTVNQSTGALTLVGATGVTESNFLAGLDFFNGTLYEAVNGNLYSLNTSTGHANIIGSSGFSDISGLNHLAAATSVPEPTTLALLGLGLAAIGALRRGKLN